MTRLISNLFPKGVLRFVVSLMLAVFASTGMAQQETSSADGESESSASTGTYFDDMKGATKSGVPRLIRNIGVTEVFFNGLSDSYVIQDDNSHNAFFYAIEKAQKAGTPISFRAEPVSRRILAVDGVNNVSARKPGSEDDTVDEEADPKKPRRRHKKAIDPRKATTTVGTGT